MDSKDYNTCRECGEKTDNEFCDDCNDNLDKALRSWYEDNN